MPRIRHRMRSRRGASRGQIARLPSSSNSGSTSNSSEFFAGHYPDTRSGRGQRSVHSLSARGFTQTMPSLSSPPAHSHNVQFCFPCANCSVTMVANFTFDIHANSEQQNIQAEGELKEKGLNDLLSSSPVPNLKQADIGGSEVHGTGTQGNQSKVKAGDSKVQDDFQMQDEDTQDYGCRIIEEQSPE